jgi:ferredoxin
MCYFECPTGAITIVPNVSAVIDQKKCIRCGKCIKECQAEAIVKIKNKD